MDGQTLVSVGLVLLFVLIGGVFAATEIALVSLRASQLVQLEREGSRGQRVAAVARDPNRFLAAVQVGVTVAGFFSAAYGAATIAPDLVPFVEALGLDMEVATTVTLVLMTLVIAYLSLVLGELVPKRLALQRPAVLAKATAPTLDRFAAMMRPVIWLLSASTNGIVRLIGGDPHEVAERLSDDELRDLVVGHETLDDDQRTMLRDVLDATATTVKEVMRPRGDVVFLRADTALAEVVDIVRGLPYSRYPIVDQGIDDVVGFLHIRDVIGLAEGDARRVSDVRRPVLLMPSTNRVLPAMATMRQEGIHLAIIVDEYGGTDGIVTLEDLIEELVGAIRDEHDPVEPTSARTDLAAVDAGLSLEDFREHTGVALEEGPYETAAGYVMARLGRIPKLGDGVELDRGRLEVREMVGRRVTRLAVMSPPSDEED